MIKLVTEKKEREESKKIVIDSGFRKRKSSERDLVLFTCEKGFVPFYNTTWLVWKSVNCHVSEYAVN